MVEQGSVLHIRWVCEQFGIRGEVLHCVRLNGGHINETYRVCLQDGARVRAYVLQKVNTYVFQNPVAVMENISGVTAWLKRKAEQKINSNLERVLEYLPSLSGRNYLQTEDGEFWRCCLYVPESFSLAATDDLALVEESAKAYGRFEKDLTDYPVSSLNIVIPHFHNTANRYATFRDAVRLDVKNRLRDAMDAVETALALEEIATRAYRWQEQGLLPLRVTHNDTKLSNVLFHAETKRCLAVIDLDTVMPGLSAFDFGDAIRACACTAEEDESDLGNVTLDLEKYAAFTRGFVSELNGELSTEELLALPLGAIAMAAECGVRFLSDYLQGDVYFRIHYETQNLIRARCQLHLAQEMIKKRDEMFAVVEACALR